MSVDPNAPTSDPGTQAGNGAQPNEPQPGAPGQGQGQGDGFRSTFFPNVPDEQWNLIAPHMENVNKHVTQLQQRFAPLNGYTPEAVQGLAQFAQQFDADPVGQWVSLARMLQQRGTLDPDLDLDHLEALVMGQEPPNEGGAAPNGNGAVAPTLDGLPPEVVQMMTGLQQTVEQLQNRLNQQDQTTRQRAEDAAITRNLNWMKTQLKEGGLSEELLTDERLLSAFVAHRGNAQNAVKDLMDFRSGMLQGYVQQGQRRTKQPLKTDGVPASGQRPKNPSNRRGMFQGVSAAAEQYLRSQSE
jgi:hypothetical protein